MSNKLAKKIYLVEWIVNGRIGHFEKVSYRIVSIEDIGGRSINDDITYLTDKSLTIDDEDGNVSSINYFSVKAKNEQDAIEKVKSYIRKNVGTKSLEV